MSEVSFPRQAARTLRFMLGVPRSFRIGSDGRSVLFLRSKSGTDRVTCLWQLDLDSMTEELIADPAALLGGAGESLSPEERALRERTREAAAGIVGFNTDADMARVCFMLSGSPWVLDLPGSADGKPRRLDCVSPVIDPRIDPTGSRIAYVTGGGIRIFDLAAGTDTELVAAESGDVKWGLAEHVAAEEMGRTSGFWWLPDGQSLLVARVDNSPVQRWYIADPANPDRPAVELAYPAAGTPNADVTLWLVGLDGSRREIDWDRAAYPYLTRVWCERLPGIVQVQSRDQRRVRMLSVAADGGTSVLRDQEDPVWIELMQGVPSFLPDGRLLHPLDDVSADTRYLALDGQPVTPPGLQVRSVLSVGESGVVFAGATEDATQLHLWRLDPEGHVQQLTTDPGVHMGSASGDVVVATSRSLEHTGARTVVYRRGEPIGEIESLAETPSITPRARVRSVGPRALNTSLLLPENADGPLPVIMDPYGGPHAQRVVSALGAYTTSQWFADQGFAVVVVDGRGSPGRGPQWEKAIAGDLATPVLEDQVEALHALAADHPELDLTRVGIRGASFGGYLSALAVLRRPDVFHAAVATASVTDWTLYDTHYTERYLGDPNQSPDVYARSSLLADAPKLERPLLLVHGLADDNVVVAHTLRLSAALLAAGRPHQVLPLSGITHMTAPSEVVAENLLALEVDFFKTHLAA
ncbi:MAG TPA: prolyl oligopeptidase family serine peptidase [Acidimicrobiales bacterium]|nr:prolyl oligopeptidase family serine peptidase [Acidimicrobiales bacterium]